MRVHRGLYAAVVAGLLTVLFGSAVLAQDAPDSSAPVAVAVRSPDGAEPTAAARNDVLTRPETAGAPSILPTATTAAGVGVLFAAIAAIVRRRGGRLLPAVLSVRPAPARVEPRPAHRWELDGVEPAAATFDQLH